MLSTPTATLSPPAPAPPARAPLPTTAPRAPFPPAAPPAAPAGTAPVAGPVVPPVLALTATRAAAHRVGATLAAGGLTNPVTGLHTSTEAEHYLLGRGPWRDRDRHPLPAVVVADLHLSSRTRAGSAVDLLRLRRSHPDLARIPVVVVGRQASDDEIDLVHRLGAAAYLADTVAAAVLVDVIRGLGMRWSLASAAS